MCRYLNNCLAYLVDDTSISVVFAPAAPGTLMNRSDNGFLQISSEGAPVSKWPLHQLLCCRGVVNLHQVVPRPLPHQDTVQPGNCEESLSHCDTSFVPASMH